MSAPAAITSKVAAPAASSAAVIAKAAACRCPWWHQGCRDLMSAPAAVTAKAAATSTSIFFHDNLRGSPTCGISPSRCAAALHLARD